MKKIAIMFGGVSLEHEVSIITGLQVLQNIDEKKHNAFAIYIDKNGEWWSGNELKNKEFYAQGKNDYPNKYLDSFSTDFSNLKENIDVAILCFHGGIGEGGGIQGVLEAAKIPYQGPNVASSAVALDKIFTRQILRSENISQPDFGWFHINEYKVNKKSVIESAKKIGFPLYIKVSNSGSSIGVKKVNNEKEFNNVLKELSLYGDRFIYEKEVDDCIEVNISVKGNQEKIQVSSSEQPIKSDELLSFDDKYTKGGGKKSGMVSASRRIPAPISGTTEKKLQTIAKQIFQILNLEGIVRIDFFVNPSTSDYYVIEINTIPGSLSYYLWEYEKVKFSDLIDSLISIAENKSKKDKHKTTIFPNNLLKK